MITSFFKPKTDSKRQRREGDEENGGHGANKRLNVTSSVKETKAPDSTSPSDAVELLCSYIRDVEGPNGHCWKTQLDRHFQSPGFRRLAAFVAAERKSQTIYPPAENTFDALNYVPLDKVKVVIVGQDPYHGPGQAHGLCFSVLPGQAIPPSLRNIYKELSDDSDVVFPPKGRSMPDHGYLASWAKQGVLMLNTVLTVRRGQANSHQKKGWEAVTDEILRIVDRSSRDRGKGVVFLLWGRPATAKAQAILQSSQKFKGSPLHTVICTSHPSPLGARKTDKPFMGSKCFSRCNAALKEKGHDPIDWNVDLP